MVKDDDNEERYVCGDKSLGELCTFSSDLLRTKTTLKNKVYYLK
jgi:hypothetical protein